MANLKDLRVRIASVKSTQKITSAMKMVAAAKLRRAQEAAESARPYAGRMRRVVAAVADGVGDAGGAPPLLAGTGADETVLLVVCTSNRGLCGAFNGSIVREVRRRARDLVREGKSVKFLCVGRKGRDLLKREFESRIVDTYEDVGRKSVTYAEAQEVASRIADMFEEGAFDVCNVVFNRFQSAMTQIVTTQQLVPLPGAVADDGDGDAGAADAGPKAAFIFEPDEQDILADLLPRNLTVQVYQAMLESSASEHGARMTAMDSATRNAGDMIDGLTLTYNRTRQAVITSELIEIISGAEAL